MLDWLGLSKKPQQEQVIPTMIIQDQVPEIKVAIPDTKPVSLMPSVRSLVLGYHNQRSAGRGAFRPSEYDLAEMGRIEDSVAGHRCTIIKSNEKIEVITFKELFERYKVLVTSSDKDRIFDPGIETLTWENNKPCWKPIKQIIRHKVNKKGFAVYQKTGCTVVTADHSLIEDGSLKEITAFQLHNTKSKIARVKGKIPRTINTDSHIDISEFISSLDRIEIKDDTIKYQYQGIGKQKGIIRKLSISRFLDKKDLLVVLGAYISEGSVVLNKDTNRYGSFCIASQDINWLKQIQKSFTNLFGDISVIKTYKDGMSRLRCSKELIATLFANLGGYTSAEKQLPSFVFSLDQEHANILLKYLIHRDGNRQTYGWSYTTKSTKLASGYSTLLRLLGINHTFNYRKNHNKIYYNIRTNLHYKKHTTKTVLLEANFNNEYVYDLEVEDTHMFVDAAGQILLHNTDSYVRQAFEKKTALMFKEGWGLVGKNPRTIKYVKSRLAQIAQASNTPTNTLFRNIGSNIVRKSNSFLLKVRKTEASGGKVRTIPGSNTTLQPVAGYFPIPSETMEFELTGTKISRWKQKMPNGEYKLFSPQDIIHIFHARKDGFVFGTPGLIPVIDDIRALRKIEENVELLIYQHLFPLFQYKVGTPESPAGFTEDGQREIDVVRTEIQFMPTEGGIVTPERHEITAIGSEGRALRIESYLEHFKNRVFSGLGVSAVDMGEGNTANRACYSEDTQTLTDSGFKYYWQITPEDKIATFNPKTEELEYHYPNGDILLYDYSGKMIAFRNRNIDVLVTPDHDMWVGQPRYSKDLDWQKIHADSINQFQFKFRTGSLGWTGIDPENFQLPHVPYQCHSIVPNSGPFPRIDIYDWLEFLGYFVSEGCLAKSKNKWAITLSQNERVNPIKTERIRQCLNKLPFKYNEYTDPKDQTTRFWINCKSLYLYLQEKCGDYSYLKHLPHEILEYKRDYLDTLFDALMLGDGTVDKREGRTSRTYYSNSEVLLDQVQEIALKLGYRAHILPGSRCGRVCISENTVSNITKDYVSEVDYSGKVYCFNIPNHLFITRRNGRIGIHGNTADNMSRNLVDAVKDLQQIVEDAINQEIINELLLESNFGVDVLDEENIVRLKFKEIDVDAQIKKENHGADLFTKDIIDHDEARARLGLEPWVVPNPEEVQAGTDTPEEFPQWHKSRWKMFELPKLLIQAVDEPWSPAAIAAAGDSSLPMKEKDNEEFAKQQNDQEIALEKEKTKAKVAVAKAKQRPTARKDGYLRSTFLQTKKDIVGKVSIEKTIDHDWTASLIRTQMSTTVNRILADQLIEFRKGYSQFASVETQQFISSTTSARLQLRERSETFINKLTENVISALRRNVNPNSDDLIEKTRAVFESVEFRTSFIEDVEIKKAHSLGIALAIRDTNASVLLSNKTSHDQACATCSSKNGQGIAPAAATLDILPPHHAGCSCSLVLAQTTIQNSVINDAVRTTLNKGVKKNIGSNRAQYRRCTSKYKAALKSQDPNLDENLLNTLAEAACNFLLSDEVEEDIEDATLEECVLSVKESLRKKHPDWDEDKIKLSAFAICKSRNKGD